MDKQLVVVSRKWHEPFIRVDVTSIGIGVTMSLDDFVVALEVESGQPGLAGAAERVVAGMKKETSQAL
jgi:hypothetical protein